MARVLNDAGLLVRQYAGVAPLPVVAAEGREGLMESLSGSGLLVIGLSDRWQEEGLGSTRAAIARSGVAPRCSSAEAPALGRSRRRAT